MLQIIFILCIITFSIQLGYYLFIFGKFSFSNKNEKQHLNYPLSVIVCVKNQEENIQKLVPLLLEQNYPNFEIVLIDYASTDKTLDILEEFEKNHKKIKLVKVENNEAFWGNKKFALTLGIKAAKNEHLLFTEPNCIPASNQWISQMAAHFSKEKTIILGFNDIKSNKNIFQKLIRFENTFSATQAFSWALAGSPYTGFSENLAYKREEFFNTNGYISHIKSRTGEDTLFINEAANKTNTTISTNIQSHTILQDNQTSNHWINELKIKFTNTSKIKFIHKLKLSIFYLAQLLFLPLAIILLITSNYLITTILLVFFRYIFSWITIGYAFKKLNNKDLIIWFPFLEIATSITYLYIYLSNFIQKPNDWK